MIKNVVKNLSIKFSKFMINSDKDKMIDVYIIKDIELIKLDIFLEYMKKKSASNKKYLGIDFEFNNLFSKKENKYKRHVALIQINFNDEFIIMFHPEHISSEQKIKLKSLLFHDNIIKILHGSESLDIKYLFTKFFSNKNEKKLFLKNFFDTKFICEYLNITDENFGINKKCKIYQLVLKSGLINQSILNKLEENEKKMGPIYKVIVNVNKMTNELIKYTLFDVFYLIQLFIRLNIDKNNLDLINYFLHNNLLERDLIENDLLLISKFNNCYIIVDGEKYTLTNILEYYNGLLVLQYNYNIINDIPYFKKMLNLIIKKVLIKSMAKYTKVYCKKNMLINNQIKNFTKNYRFDTNSIYTNDIYNYINNDIKKLIYI